MVLRSHAHLFETSRASGGMACDHAPGAKHQHQTSHEWLKDSALLSAFIHPLKSLFRSKKKKIMPTKYPGRILDSRGRRFLSPPSTLEFVLWDSRIERAVTRLSTRLSTCQHILPLPGDATCFPFLPSGGRDSSVERVAASAKWKPWADLGNHANTMQVKVWKLGATCIRPMRWNKMGLCKNMSS